MTEDAAGAEVTATDPTHYPWDLPKYNKTAKFFAALKEGGIETTKCKTCGTVQWPPRSICSSCLSEDLDWVELTQNGELVAFSQANVGLEDFEKAPVTVAVVRLDDGLRLLTRIEGAPFDSLRSGLKVRLSKASLVKGKPYWTFSVITF